MPRLSWDRSLRLVLGALLLGCPSWVEGQSTSFAFSPMGGDASPPVASEALCEGAENTGLNACS